MSTTHWPLVISLVLASIDWLVVARRKKRLEYVFKPATMVALLIWAWLLTQGPHDDWEAGFLLPGLALSLIGDILLMLDARFFLPGLAAFLLAHLCYIAALNSTPPPWPTFALLAVVAAVGLPLYRAITDNLRRRGQTALVMPVTLYSLVISLMLLSAWATLFRPEWTRLRRGLVAAGASLFFASDAMLAWDRFVKPSPSARLRVMVTYHLGQIALAASIALWA